MSHSFPEVYKGTDSVQLKLTEEVSNKTYAQTTRSNVLDQLRALLQKTKAGLSG